MFQLPGLPTASAKSSAPIFGTRVAFTTTDVGEGVNCLASRQESVTIGTAATKGVFLRYLVGANVFHN
jgi:hypothetical protein